MKHVGVVVSETKEEVQPKHAHQLAWDHLNDDKSWMVASEKNDVLTESYGLTSWEDLAFVTSEEIEDLMGRLKTVPARKFQNYMQSHK